MFSFNGPLATNGNTLTVKKTLAVECDNCPLGIKAEHRVIRK